ncbi:MAG: immunoglobulin domain-containing protein [Phycisphaerae bacterium]
MKFVATVLAVTVLICSSAPVLADDSPPIEITPPPSHEIKLSIDSTALPSPNSADGVARGAAIIYSTEIGEAGATWMRLQFGPVQLAGVPEAGTGSFLRISSFQDGGTQVLDARTLAQWQNTSAYFNGERVLLEMLAYPGTGTNRVEVSGATFGERAPFELRSLCGNDDRLPVTDNRIGRYLPLGCTTFMIDDLNHTLLTAGHCTGNPTGNLVEFNVPMSLSDGTIQHSIPEDQYPVDVSSLQRDFTSDAKDWSYFGVFANSITGLSPFQAQGQVYFQISPTLPSTSGTTLRQSGLGSVTAPQPLEWNQWLKTSTGPYVGTAAVSQVRYRIDGTFGDSGSPVTFESNGKVVAINVNSGCLPDNTGFNRGTGVNNTLLRAALAAPRGICASGAGAVSPPLYAAGDLVNNFGTLNRSSGSFGKIALVPRQMQGMTYNANSGLFYAIDIQGKLYTLDPASGASSLLGAVTGTASQIAGLGFDALSGVLYGNGQSDGQLYGINPATLVATPIGAPGGGNVGGLEYDQLAGILYGLDDAVGGTRLVQFDVNTGARTIIGSLGAGIADCNGLAWCDIDALLYTVNSANGQLLSINPATGAATVVGASGGMFGGNLGLAAVMSAPWVSNHPVGQTGCGGSTITLTASATGAGPLSYQWRKDGNAIPGANGASLALNGVIADDAGSYDVVVTNAFGSRTSNSAAVVVEQAPTITNSPSSQTTCDGTGVSLSVVAGGTSLAYQWRKAGLDIPGETASTLTLASAGVGDAGSYDVVVTNSCGSATSDSASIVIDFPPTLNAPPSGGSACAGGSAMLTVNASGSGLTYVWRRDGEPIDVPSTASLTIDPVTPIDGGSYDVVISNSCGSVTSSAAVLSVDVVPAISTQPANQTACDGASVTFAVAASGSGLTYQWRKDGAPINGATLDTLTINPVSAADLGDYDVVVTNNCGNATSAIATITLDSPPTISTQPTNQTACDGASVTFSVAASGSGLTYQWRKDGAPINGATLDTLTINPVSAADLGDYDVVVSNNCGNATSAIATITLDSPPTISTQPANQTACDGASVTFSVAASGSGLTYQWRKDGAPINGATLDTLTINSVTAADAGNYDVVISNGCGGTISAVASLSLNPATVITSQPASQSVCEHTNVSFTVATTGVALTYQWRKDGIPIPGAIAATLAFDADDAHEGLYDCVVTGNCGSATSAGAALLVYDDLGISAPPIGASVCENTGFTFSVLAAGGGLSYQWRKDAADIPGANAASLVLASVSPADAGSYDVVVSNLCGSVTSPAAALVVSAIPAIQLQPQPATVCIGGSWSLSVSATGAGPLQFQWRKDGQALVGATSATLALSPVPASAGGLYDVVISNTCGSVTSASALLTAAALPGDLDLDGAVGPSDLGVLLGAWRLGPGGDLNGDNQTDEADLGILLGAWGSSCP